MKARSPRCFLTTVLYSGRSGADFRPRDHLLVRSDYPIDLLVNSTTWRFWLTFVGAIAITCGGTTLRSQAHILTCIRRVFNHCTPGKVSSDRVCVVCWLVVSRSNMYSPRLCHTFNTAWHPSLWTWGPLHSSLQTATDLIDCPFYLFNVPNRRGSFQLHVDRSICRPTNWGTTIDMPGKTVFRKGSHTGQLSLYLALYSDIAGISRF